MLMPDVNVLVYAHRADAKEHVEYATWLEAVAQGPEPFALSESVAHGFLRIVTNGKVFKPPTPLEEAIGFVEQLRNRPHCHAVRPGPANWAIFVEQCREARATGKLVADAAHAALAIEHGCEWVTNDADFARFPGLRWRHPLRR